MAKQRQRIRERLDDIAKTANDVHYMKQGQSKRDRKIEGDRQERLSDMFNYTDLYR